MKHLRTVFTLSTLFFLMSCNASGNKNPLEWFLDMHDAHYVRAQEEDYTTLSMVKTDAKVRGADSRESFAGPGSTMRVPPEGTVPRGYEPYPYDAADFDSPQKELVNPLKRTKAVLERGKKQYEIFCAVCHGRTGMGDGTVTPMFPVPPPLKGASLMWKDGGIFHMITMGRGQMKSYQAQISPEDRWAIVHYVRLLQAN